MMNKQEIDDMMKDLPSQQVQEETLIQKITIGIMFILVLVLMMWAPDFILSEEECLQQNPRAITIGLCSESKAK
jgi:hypothetical protein